MRCAKTNIKCNATVKQTQEKFSEVHGYHYYEADVKPDLVLEFRKELSQRAQAVEQNQVQR